MLRLASLFLLSSLVACGGGTTLDAGVVTDAGGAADARSDGSASDLGGGPVDLGGGHADLGGCIDADGDGHGAIACGGDDCDDADANRYPSNAETCDAANHDEDCVPTTFGGRDGDGDTYVDAACCNADPAGGMHCGNDCDDATPTVHPTAPEVCNGHDDDCNGMSDDGLTFATYYVDCDGDGHGVAAGSLLACTMPAVGPTSCSGGSPVWATTMDDCDDTTANAHPGAVERCDGIDDDCDGTHETDADGDMHFAAGTCTPLGTEPLADDCRDDLVEVHPGVTTYSGTPGCAAGTRGCIGGLGGPPTIRTVFWCVPTATACPTSFVCSSEATCAYPRATFDYDCSGAENAMPPFTSCGTDMAMCPSHSGFSYSGTPPACGVSSSFNACIPSLSSCSAMPMTLPFRCR